MYKIFDKVIATNQNGQRVGKIININASTYEVEFETGNPKTYVYYPYNLKPYLEDTNNNRDFFLAKLKNKLQNAVVSEDEAKAEFLRELARDIFEEEI